MNLSKPFARARALPTEAFSPSRPPPRHVGADHDAMTAPASHPVDVVQRMQAPIGSLAASDVGALQGMLGNRATARVLSRKKGSGASAKAGSLSPSSGSARRLPEGLRAGIEGLSGLGMDDVRVHYNSNEPTAFDALAFTAGSEIHVAPGQEAHLAHEAWHVVQQKQGRVAPSIKVGGEGINTDTSLEHEADFMGAQAKSFDPMTSRLPSAMDSAASAGALGQDQASAGGGGASVRQFACGGGTIRQTPSSKEVFKSPELDYLADETNVMARGDIRRFDRAVGYSEEEGGMRIEERQAQWYVVRDEKQVFYHAASTGRGNRILAGRANLTPTPDFTYFKKSSSDWMSSGYLYFSLDSAVAVNYAQDMAHGDDFVLLGFTLPKGTEITVDPEIPGALRMKETVNSARVFKAWVPEKNKMKPSKIKYAKEDDAD